MIMFQESGKTSPSQRLMKEWNLGKDVEIFDDNGTILYKQNIFIHSILKSYFMNLDYFLVTLGFSGLVITDLFRKFDPDKLSYHPIGQAGDGRRWGIENRHKVAINHWIRAHRIIYPMIEFVWESDHFHVEFDNNHPLIKGDKT
ncbi:hypothetical protein KAR91_64350 [Candidatus Pacearchaeota archaeon]|nr:hypothetical protein [Candidatus Pacearchaeota archaeon]